MNNFPEGFLDALRLAASEHVNLIMEHDGETIVIPTGKDRDLMDEADILGWCSSSDGTPIKFSF